MLFYISKFLTGWRTDAMDSELEKEWEESYKRRKKKRRKKRFINIIGSLLVLGLLFIILQWLDCFGKGKRLISRERTLSPEEWSYYASLKIKAGELQKQQTQIRVYEELLKKFREGGLGSYTKRDSVAWVESSLELKRKFNKALKDSKYNSIMNLVPKFSDPDYLPKGFDPLPASFMPYVLNEAELGEALKKPEEWIDHPPDSTETEEPKKDAH